MASTGELATQNDWQSLPNIPGIRRNPVVPKRVPQTYRVAQGEVHETGGHASPEAIAGEVTEITVQRWLLHRQD